MVGSSNPGLAMKIRPLLPPARTFVTAAFSCGDSPSRRLPKRSRSKHCDKLPVIEVAVGDQELLFLVDTAPRRS